MNNKKKFVIWLHNHTDQRDDEWVVVWAKDKKQVSRMVINFYNFRFSQGRIMTAKEFREEMGFAA